MLSMLSAGLLAAVLVGQSPAEPPAPPPAAAQQNDAGLTLIQDRRSDREPVRWDRGVCVGVSGLSAQSAQFVVDRVSQRAAAVGLRAGAPGCEPNVIILVTDDPDGVARGVSNRREFVSSGSSRSQSRQELAAFLETDRAVRWWYIWQAVGEGGQVVSSDDRNRNIPELRVPDRGRVASRHNTRQAFTHAIIIVDSAQVTGVQMNALADYIAMAALAQMSPTQSSDGQPTIMTLFNDVNAGRTPPTEMTSWDQARLQSLYETPR